MQRSRIVRTAVSLSALTLVAAGGAWALDHRTGTVAAAPAGAPRVELAAYRTFSGCDDLLARLRAQALPLVTPFGLATGVDATPFAVPQRQASKQTDAAPGGDAPGATSSTGTNVQVAGVDEADVTKKSGDLILTVAGGRSGLSVLRAGDRQVQLVGRLATDWQPDQLLVQGTHVLVFGAVPLGPGGGIQPGGETPKIIPQQPGWARRTRVAEVDVADPAHPRLVRTLDMDGQLVGARLAGGVVRLAVSSPPPRLHFVYPGAPASGGTGQGTSRSGAEDPGTTALEANRRVVGTSPVDAWLPRYTLTPAGGAATDGQLVPCEHIGTPDQFSGVGTLAMLTFDLRSGGGVDRWQSAGVLAGGATLYSTGDHTYVTTRPWSRLRPMPVRRVGPVPPAGTEVPDDGATPAPGASLVPPQPSAVQRTAVHGFATTADGVQYLGSGSVEGSLVGQYALDEYDGRLRVATTSAPAWGGPLPADGMPRPGVARPATSAVTVLQLRDGRLEQVGRVDGLGPGETIHAVRFAGPRAYVVTFRRTDPLFVLDLADPAHPKVAGQLDLLGYSAYLHPLGDGLVLGVGQDATADGARQGLLMSLFDVSDAAAPRLLDRVSIPGAWSQTEGDPHAFTYADGLALVPLEAGVAVAAPLPGGASVDQVPAGGGVVAVRVSGRKLTAPTLLHLSGPGSVDPAALRTFVDAASLWTVAPGSPTSVAAVHDATTLAELSSTRF